MCGFANMSDESSFIKQLSGLSTKPNGKKEGVMNLTLKFWNEMGYKYLGKTAQNCTY